MSSGSPSLDNVRKRIDEIDAELVRLLDERAAIARDVGRAKADSGYNTYDPGRANKVLERAIERSDGTFPREGLASVFREVQSACLNLQKPLRVGFLGPSATFSHQAALREFGRSAKFEATKTIRDLFLWVSERRIDYAVAPVENSTGGVIHESLDSFVDFPQVRICSEVLLPIHHALLGHASLDKVKKVYGHRQTFVQCERWLRKNLPGAELIETASTVRGAQEAARQKTAAAIASELAAEHYGLQTLAQPIEDNPENTTRFLVIALNDSRPSGNDRTSLMVSVKNKPGALFELVKLFADHGVNMTKIESRPNRRRSWEYVFFIDLDGHREEPKVAETIRQLGTEGDDLHVLGSYPKAVPETAG